MATMPNQDETQKPVSHAPNQGEGKTTESTEHRFPVGHQSPGTPPSGDLTYKTEEPKRHAADPNTGEKPKRAPEHEPGYEAKHRKEASKQTKSDPASMRSQADDSAAKREADDELNAHHTQKANRTRPAAAKQHIKRATPAKAKKPMRKHK